MISLFVGERGLRRQELVNWYLTEMEGDIDSEQQLLENKMLTEMVIDRLIQHVSHTMVGPRLVTSLLSHTGSSATGGQGRR